MVKETVSGEGFTITVGEPLQSWEHAGETVTIRRTRIGPGLYELHLERTGDYARIRHEKMSEFAREEAENLAKALRSDMGVKGCLPGLWYCPFCMKRMISKVESIESSTRYDTGQIRDAWPADVRHRPALWLPLDRLLELAAVEPK